MPSQSMNEQACLVLVKHWQKQVQERDTLIGNIYCLTKDAPMDSGNGRTKRLDKIHDLVAHSLTPPQKLAFYSLCETYKYMEANKKLH